MENERNIFIDTWGWIVIHNKREERHREVRSFYRNFRLRGGMVYTTDYVLDETFTLFSVDSLLTQQSCLLIFSIQPSGKVIRSCFGLLQNGLKPQNNSDYNFEINQ